ncbi:histone lysine demethylase PHF8-like [Hetaerina americana]|uniref:histone lysine demethylase PHF8-like n=1 Tax=Hetaerina americana TaxID=62018 RepID=UPI003A7F41E7
MVRKRKSGKGHTSEPQVESMRRGRNASGRIFSGTQAFVELLKSKNFPSADEVSLTMNGHQLTHQYLLQEGFNNPILVKQKDGLGMTVPSESLTADDVERFVGSDKMVDVIKVTRQIGIRMNLGKFIKYFKSPKKSRILNLISLEFSQTSLSSQVEAPYIARKLDWLNHVWPKDIRHDERKPRVGKYCLMSPKNSYTDFHIDFGGSSVWYHLHWGKKIFYLIKPTSANLSLYQRWSSSSTSDETFFGDQVDMCYKLTLKKGQTLLMPSGWIHAVLTPKDSIVFGGNFLHSLNIEKQLQVYEMERATKILDNYQYPLFQEVNWLATQSLLRELKQINDSTKEYPNHLMIGLKTLLLALKKWREENGKKGVQNQVPGSIDMDILLEELEKEIQRGDFYMKSLNSPKSFRGPKWDETSPSSEEYLKQGFGYQGCGIPGPSHGTFPLQKKKFKKGK